MDDSKKLIIAAIVVIAAIFFYKKQKNNFAPIYFQGENFEHAYSKINNKIEIHFFTPDGVALDETDSFIEFIKYDNADLSKQNIETVLNQIKSSMQLRLIDGTADAYFGMFRNVSPIYGIKLNSLFIIVNKSDYEGDLNSLKGGAMSVTDEMRALEHSI
ncbi:MAG: hypothetical protein HOO06_13375 [Bdellovibrionaceae bacterium]|nr:hypothetical protein [Pseudobdellovibrionaceae bacterium]